MRGERSEREFASARIHGFELRALCDAVSCS